MTEYESLELSSDGKKILKNVAEYYSQYDRGLTTGDSISLIIGIMNDSIGNYTEKAEGGPLPKCDEYLMKIFRNMTKEMEALLEKVADIEDSFESMTGALVDAYNYGTLDEMELSMYLGEGWKHED